MLKQILHDANTFRNQISELRGKSPLYPEIYFEEKGGCQWVSTIVEFEYNNVIYKRHHVESIVPNKICDKEYLYDKIKQSAELSMQKGAPCSFDEIVGVKTT